MSMFFEVPLSHHYENPSEYFYHLDKFFELLFAIFHRFHMQKLSCNLQRKMFSNPFIGIVIVFLMKILFSNVGVVQQLDFNLLDLFLDRTGLKNI